MRSTYDPDRDSLMIDLSDGYVEEAVSTRICDVDFGSGVVALFLDRDEKLLGISIMGLSGVVPSVVMDSLRE
ncbi:DUF2283 domain-containing protein [Frankia sp. R82]|uniref:DUF2283 domain-containing protein n=1 Tax=Frankia sp. R82 TaxID=2950553 RepID=UPI002043A582|nr:DUF2283 domain-containing protein [Frankia sp. R82]MCM3882660.1 DUF2283 domain-containing protein [Frankia sp. R82]